MDGDYDLKALAATKQQWRTLLPTLKNVRVTHVWGGPVSFTPELIPHLGALVDDRIYGFYGDIGHGVSITHLNGRVLAEMVLERSSEYSDLWFVDRKTKKWPSRTLGRLGLAGAVRAYRWLDQRAMRRAGIPMKYY